MSYCGIWYLGYPLKYGVLFCIITQPSIYGVIVYFLLCHESLNYSTGQ